MEKQKITIAGAEQKMFALLAMEDMGDRIYEFAQDLYQRYIAFIEYSYDIEGATDEDDVAWYDGIYEEFHQAVYESMIKFLTARY